MHIHSLFRYPVKSLAGETLENAHLVTGRGIPGDREWALGKAGNAMTGAWQPKATFHVLEKQEALVEVSCPHTMDDPAGRKALEADVCRRLGLDGETATKLVKADGPGFFDTLKGEISILNLASVAALEKAAGTEAGKIDPRRFRANVWLEGAKPWAENDWVGKSAVLGEAEIRFTQLTGRCAATLVNPTTAARDINILKLLKTHFNHTQMGVYAHVTINGGIKPGNILQLKS